MVEIVVDLEGVECPIYEGGGEGPGVGAGVCYVCFETRNGILVKPILVLVLGIGDAKEGKERKRRERERSLQAIVKTVTKLLGSPCLNNNVTVSCVPVDGAQEIVNVVPAVREVSAPELYRNGF